MQFYSSDYDNRRKNTNFDKAVNLNFEKTTKKKKLKDTNSSDLKHNLDYTIYSDNRKNKAVLPFGSIYIAKKFNLSDRKENIAFKGYSKELESKVPFPKQEQQIKDWLGGFLVNGKPRFNSNETDILKKKITITNIENANKILTMTDRNNKPRFSVFDIEALMPVASYERLNLIEKYADMYTKQDEPRFNGYDITEIVKIALPYNFDSIDKLAAIEDNNGQPLLNGENIAAIINTKGKLEEKDIDYIKELAEIKAKNGTTRFNGYDIADLFQISDYNFDYIKELASIERENPKIYGKTERLMGCYIASFIKEIDSFFNRIEEIKALANLKRIDGTPVVEFYNIVDFFANNNERLNLDMIEQISNITVDSKYRYKSFEICSLSEIANKDNIDFIIHLSKIKDENGKFKYEYYNISKYAKYANKENSSFVEELINTKINGENRFNLSETEEIAKEANAENIEFMRELIKMKKNDGTPRFSGHDIALIGRSAIHLKTDIINKILNQKDENGNKRFEDSKIGELCFNITNENMNIYNKLEAIRLSEGKPRFGAEGIANILYALNNEVKPENRNILLENIFDDIINHSKKDGTPIFNDYNIRYLIKNVNSENIDYMRKLLSLKTKDGEPLYESENAINQIIKGIYLNLGEKYTTFREKNLLLQELMTSLGYAKDDESKIILQSKIKEIKKSIESIIEPIPVADEANNNFWNNFLITANKKNYKVIKTLDKVIEQYGQTGLPLEYSRYDFVYDLKNLLQNLSDNERKDILKKLDIELKDNTYEGFINLKALDKNSPKEAEIQKVCEKFLLENKIVTGDEKTDKFLNSIIKGVPEFVNIIGKKQHGIHKYMLDMHILKVLKEVVSNPKFENLSNEEKMIAQLMTLFHDIGKLGGIDDDEHEKTSAIITNDILGRFKLPEFTKKRIVELIKYHNWFEKINNEDIDAHTAAVMFRNPGDIKIMEIFADADLKGVDDYFYFAHKCNLNKKVEEVNKALDELYSTGNMVFPTRILDVEKIPVEEYKGKKYRVLNITKLPDDADLTKYGLSVKNKKDLRFLFHEGDIITMQSLTKPFNEAVICVSMISPDKKATHNNCNSGMLLDAPNTNVIDSFFENQISGMERDFRSFVIMTKSNSYYRKIQREEFIKALSQKYKVTENDYGEIYKHLVDKKYLNQIKDVKLQNGTIIKSQDIKNAYKAVEDYIMQNSQNAHNEINLYNPQLKGIIILGDSLEDIENYGYDKIDYIREHNLPIFLMGKNNQVLSRFFD